VPSDFDVFVSFAWADIESVRPLVAALRDGGLSVWFAETQIDNFESITRAVKEGLLHSKALLAFYSRRYPERPACQWELRTAFTAAQLEGEPARRVLVVNPERDEKGNPIPDHIHPIELRDAKFGAAPASGDAKAARALAASVHRHLATIDGLFPGIDPLLTPEWFGTEKPILYERFVGRFAEMWAVHSTLHRSDTVLISGAAGKRFWPGSTLFFSARLIRGESSGSALWAMMNQRLAWVRKRGRRSGNGRWRGLPDPLISTRRV
jgi:TIR domain-containing protein